MGDSEIAYILRCVRFGFCLINTVFLFAGFCFPGQTGGPEPGAEGWVLRDFGLRFSKFVSVAEGFIITNRRLNVLQLML